MLRLSQQLGRRYQKATGAKFKYPMGPDGALLIGGRHAGIGGGDWICTQPGHWLYDGTGMEENDTIKGLVGWEWHGHPARELPASRSWRQQ